MDKVRECGLMFSREGTRQERKDVGEDECVETNRELWRVVAGNADAIMKGLRYEDARRHWRAGARHDSFDLEFPYDVSE